MHFLFKSHKPNNSKGYGVRYTCFAPTSTPDPAKSDATRYGSWGISRQPKSRPERSVGFWDGSFLLFIRPCCHDEDRQAARMKALKHGISDGSQWPVRYSNSAPITLIARTNVAYGRDAILKKCDINCGIITQLIISSRCQRDQVVRPPPEMGSEPKNSQLGNRHRAEIRLSAHNP